MDIVDAAKRAISSVISDKVPQDLATAGDLDVINFLTMQHREVDALFAEYEAAGEKAYRTKEKIFAKIQDKLTLHAELEEAHFYPAVENFDIKRVREAAEEHTLVKEMLVKADELAAEDETFDAKVKVLRELVQHHVREEENEIFPECRENMSEERLQELGARLQELTRDAEQPAPPAPKAAKKTAKSRQHKH